MKRAFICMIALVLAVIPVQAMAFKGYAFIDGRMGDAWVRTVQGRWHYDAGPLAGIRLEEGDAGWQAYLELAVSAMNNDDRYSSGLGFAITGQKTKLGAKIGYDELSFEAYGELKSWFISGPECGPNWMVEANDIGESFNVRVTARLF
jgi:hypothetical protein